MGQSHQIYFEFISPIHNEDQINQRDYLATIKTREYSLKIFSYPIVINRLLYSISEGFFIVRILLKLYSILALKSLSDIEIIRFFPSPLTIKKTSIIVLELVYC